MTIPPVTVKTVKEMLSRKKLAPLKSLGQNFLVDRHCLDKIISAGELSPEDWVLEIGPGLGGLTGGLVAQAGRVVAVEYDRGMYAALQETFDGIPNLTLINDDFLRVDLGRLLDPAFPKRKVIANLPYYITTPILFALLESRITWERMVFLVQKEVAQRMAATPGSKLYGGLTVMLNFYGKVEMLFSVPKEVFYPAPKVDSAVVRIVPSQGEPLWQEYPYLQRVVSLAFGQRRKTIMNALGDLASRLGGKENLREILIQSGIDPAQRGETIKAEVFLRIADELRKRTVEGV